MDLDLGEVTTRWSMRVSLPSNLQGDVTKFAPHKALKLIAWGQLTFDERVVVRRVALEALEALPVFSR